MLGRILCPVTAAALALAPAGARAAVAFIGIEGLGLDRATVQPIERLLERALADQIGTTLVRPDQVAAALVRPGLETLRGCTGEIACLVDLGGVLDVDLVVYGTLTRLGSDFVIVLRAIEVASGQEVGRVREPLSGSEEGLLDAVRFAARQLLDPYAFLREVVFADLPADARVEVDGQTVAAIAGDSFRVTAGRHAVTVTRPELGPRSFWIDVAVDGVTRVDASRDRLAGLGGGAEPTTAASGGTTPWWPLAVSGAGGALLITSGALGIVSLVSEHAYVDDYRNHALEAAALRDRYDTGRAIARWTNVTLGAGITVAGVGVAAWLLRGNPAQPPSALQRFLGDHGQYLALGAGGAALATGTTLGALSWREERAFIESYRTQPGDEAALRGHRDRGERYALWANVLLTAGALLVTAGALDWWLLGAEPPAGESSP